MLRTLSILPMRFLGKSVLAGLCLSNKIARDIVKGSRSSVLADQNYRKRHESSYP